MSVRLYETKMRSSVSTWKICVQNYRLMKTSERLAVQKWRWKTPVDNETGPFNCSDQTQLWPIPYGRPVIFKASKIAFEISNNFRNCRIGEFRYYAAPSPEHSRVSRRYTGCLKRGTGKRCKKNVASVERLNERRQNDNRKWKKWNEERLHQIFAVCPPTGLQTVSEIDSSTASMYTSVAALPLLQIFSWFLQWKQYENWSIFD